MNKVLLLSCCLLLAGNLLAQNRTREFELDMPTVKVGYSLYDSIEYLDSRMDTTNFGTIQLGAFNRKARVVVQKPFLAQLRSVMNAMIDSTARQGTILLQLRQFNFAELTGVFSEKGFLNLRAKLYRHDGARYEEIASIDTAIVINNLDVTKELLRTGSTVLTHFISENLIVQTSGGSVYGLNEIIGIDSVEKSKLAVYTTDKYTDGLYYSFNSLKTQAPDKKEVFVEMNDQDGTISSVLTLDKKRRKVKVKHDEIYAAIYNGTIYISTDYGYYPLMNNDGELCFTGDIKVSANPKDVFINVVALGIIVGTMVSHSTATYVIQLDHVNGAFIPLRAIVAPKVQQ